MMLSNIKNNRNTLSYKSQNYSLSKNPKDSKIIRMGVKESKISAKSKVIKKKNNISKFAIDLFRTNPIKSTRMNSDERSKEYHSVKEDTKTISSSKSKSKSSDGRVGSDKKIEQFLSQKQANKGDDFPMLPGKALKLYMKTKLTQYEHGEILDYNQIYFVGDAKDKIQGDKDKNNNGFDDERGDYIITPHDHIAYRYEIISVLGQGSFGQVIKVIDHKNKKYLALKIIRNK